MTKRILSHKILWIPLTTTFCQSWMKTNFVSSMEETDLNKLFSRSWAPLNTFHGHFIIIIGTRAPKLRSSFWTILLYIIIFKLANLRFLIQNCNSIYISIDLILHNQKWNCFKVILQKWVVIRLPSHSHTIPQIGNRIFIFRISNRN